MPLLECIQAVIPPIAGNTFAIERWTVFLVSAFLVLACPDARWNIVVLATLPVFVPLGLDGEFLWQGRP